MKPPCELIVTKMLPSFRSAIVKALIEEHSMKQMEIAEMLGLSQSAVSQYITSARASDDRFISTFPEITEYARKVAADIRQGQLKGSEISFCGPCQSIRDNEKFIQIQQEYLQEKKNKLFDNESENSDRL
jgi:predicted transcriptional regulator